jgi:hypothetical protein
MNVRIGIAQSSQIIEITMAEDTDRDAIRKQVDKLIGNDEGVLWLTDRKGKELAVPADRISFIELGPGEAVQRIGFGA